jgi:hypothetical protein
MLVAHLSRRRCSCRCRQVGPDASGPLGLVVLLSRSLGRRATLSLPFRCVNLASGFSGKSQSFRYRRPGGRKRDDSRAAT